MIRKPFINDAKAIKGLIDPFVKEGLLLPKSLHDIYTCIRDFWVVDSGAGSQIQGCCALHVSWEDLGEIRTFAVRHEAQGSGFGRSLIDTCIEEARTLGLERLFVLTFVPDFFRRYGFHDVDKATLPNKIWADCIHCQFFPDCRETALVYSLTV